MAFDPLDFETLRAENQELLDKFSKRHDISGICEVDIWSRYFDESHAKAARAYVRERYGVPRTILFGIYVIEDVGNEETIDLRFMLQIVPEAGEIAKYEMMLRDAAEKFGGDAPGWEIKAKMPKKK